MSKIIIIFFLHIKFPYLNVIDMISNFTCIKKTSYTGTFLNLISQREREREGSKYISFKNILLFIIIHGTLYLTGIAVFR